MSQKSTAVFYLISSLFLGVNNANSQASTHKDVMSDKHYLAEALRNSDRSDVQIESLNFSMAGITTNDLSSYPYNSPLGYKKGDWAKPISWNEGYAKKAKYGDGVTIGIMDTPINCNHANLKTTEIRSCKSLTWAGANGSFTDADAFDHGSNAAGVAAGSGGFGLAKNANIVGFAVFDDTGWFLTAEQYYDAVDYLVNNENAKVINWSFGAPKEEGVFYYPLNAGHIVAARIAINKALIVKSAGNGYYNSDGKLTGASYDTTYTEIVGQNVLKTYLSNVIFVGALDSTGKKIASWSDRPGEGCFQGLNEYTCTASNKYKYYFIVAPGYVNTTAGKGNGSQNNAGTSFSAPIVAGAAALIQSNWPKLKPHQVRDILLNTATDMGEKGVDSIYGKGALNISRALMPINGKVGGVKINSLDPIIFSRLSSVSDFSDAVQVVDDYGRDYNAVEHLRESTISLNKIDLSPNSAVSIYVGERRIAEDTSEFQLSGFSINRLSYFSNISGLNGYMSFEEPNTPLTALHHSLLSLNNSNQVLVYAADDSHKMFIMRPGASSRPGSDTTTVGVHNSWFNSDNLKFETTAAVMKEKGFHGLSSVKGFGFDSDSESVFFGAILKRTGQLGSFDIGFNYHKTFSDYSSNVISWNRLGVSQIHVGLSKNIKSTKIGIKATSDVVVEGRLESSIAKLTALGDFYHKDAAISLNMDTQHSDVASTNFNLSSEAGGYVNVAYTIQF